MAGPDPDEGLVRRARDGDRAAMEELYRRHERRAYNIALRMVGNSWDAADVTQEAFVKALGGLSSFRTDARFSTWLHRIVVNAAYDHLRRKKADPTEDELLERAAEASRARWGTAESPMPDSLPETLRAALLSLPEAFRLAVVLCDLLDFPYSEAAEVLEVREGTIKSRLFRARALLAQELEERGYLSGRAAKGTPAEGIANERGPVEGLPGESESRSGNPAPRASVKPLLPDVNRESPAEAPSRREVDTLPRGETDG